MAFVMSSRFAALKIVEDDYPPAKAKRREDNRKVVIGEEKPAEVKKPKSLHTEAQTAHRKKYKRPKPIVEAPNPSPPPPPPPSPPAPLIETIAAPVNRFVAVEKDAMIEALREEVTALKSELLHVKSRNKKLCNIIGTGELRDKVEILAEAERLREMQTEYTAELAALHAELEQWRSKGPSAKNKLAPKKLRHVKFDVQEKKRSNSEKDM